MANGNGNGLKSWLVVAGLILSLGLSVFASSKDTPTRAEMEQKRKDLKAD